MALIAGTRLGTYEIVAALGAGGMGEVYRARDVRLGREVALKVLPADVAADADRLARFEREARTVAGLNHPNIVTLFSVEDDHDIRFLTMELVEGQSLADLITSGGLPLARVLELAIAIADALTAAHEKGVVHRDLKPANVMVTREGRVKVLDFGLAKLMPAPTLASTRAPTAGAPGSETGMMAGTMPHMAPEQIRAEAVDARADLFAFGILLYELLAGRRPFAGATAMVVSAAILNETPAPLSRVRTDLPGDLERIVSRCLEKNPRERAQTALDVSNELRRLRRVLERGEPEPPASGKVASIAVLPFVNRSRDEEDEYFSDGLADDAQHARQDPGLESGGTHLGLPLQGQGHDDRRGRERPPCRHRAGGERAQGRPAGADLGPAREGFGRLPPVVGDLRPHAGGYLRGAGRHRAVGGEGAARDLAGRAGGFRRERTGEGGGGQGGEGAHHRPRGAPALSPGAPPPRSIHPGGHREGDRVLEAGAGA
jgi:serine/threonine protein kinase